MEAFTALVTQASDYLWNWVLLILLVGTGLYFTLRLRFVQVRRFGEGMRRLFGGFSLHGKAAGKDGMSSFQALTTAVAAQVGTGNHHGLRDRAGQRRTGGAVLGVGIGVSGHGDDLRRSRAGAEIQDHR